MIDIELNDLIDMMIHKCHYCDFIEEGQCSQNDGCKRGIKEHLKEKFGLKDEICDS